VWLRRDLRVDDHAALYHALRAARQVWCAFVFDRAILDPLPRADRRVEFIRDSLVGRGRRAARAGSGHGVDGVGPDRAPRPAVTRSPRWPPAGRAGGLRQPRRRTGRAGARRAGARPLADAGVALHTVKDHVVFERSEVLTHRQPYSVFTPYKNAWLKKVDAFFLRAYPVARMPGAGAAAPGWPACRRWQDIGFEPTNLHQLKLPSGPAGAQELLDDFLPRIDRYGRHARLPGRQGPSYLSVHLRFGTVSIRRLAREAHAAHGGRLSAAPRSGCRS
jgi:deoxyribodipyrimidine photo-lyase